MRACFGSWEVHQNTKNVTQADIAQALALGSYMHAYMHGGLTD